VKDLAEAPAHALIGAVELDVAVLLARHDSGYKTMPGVDVWDKDRDATTFVSIVVLMLIVLAAHMVAIYF
jgi:hypothetical protein